MDTGAGSWVTVNIMQPVQALVDQLMAFVPRLLAALLILLIGWLIAKAIEAIVVRVLKPWLDKLADQIQFSSVLTKGGIRPKVSELIGSIVYWLVMLAVVTVTFNALHLDEAAKLFTTVVEFLPNVIAALFILIAGMFVAAFLAATVRTTTSNAGMLQSQLLGQVVETVVVILTIVAALKQLRFEFVPEVFLIVLGGISLGCALAFGLGCKDLARRWVGNLVEQLQSRKR